MQLTGKTAVLTGASGGIGAAMAEALAATGVRLLLVGRRAQVLDALAARLRAQSVPVVADIASVDGREAVLRACAALPGGVDILINNAGINAFGAFETMPPPAIADQLGTNLLAPMLLAQSLLPALRRVPRGLIVNVGSALGSLGYPGYVGYAASKFGLRGFSEALRRELADSTVGVLYLAPRATHTAINSDRAMALNRALGNATDAPEVVAAALLRQLRSERPYQAIGGPERVFARLNALLPGLIDRAIRRQLPTIRRFLAG